MGKKKGDQKILILTGDPVEESLINSGGSGTGRGESNFLISGRA